MTTVYLAARFGRREELKGYAERLIKELGIQTCARWLFSEHTMLGDPNTLEGLALNQRFAIEDLEDINGCTTFINFTEDDLDLPDYVDVVMTHTSETDLIRTARYKVSEVERAIGAARGGRHVELGYALGLYKRVILVGRRENVFHYLPEIEHYETFDQLMGILF